jgi:hypothetical protein
MFNTSTGRLNSSVPRDVPAASELALRCSPTNSGGLQWPQCCPISIPRSKVVTGGVAQHRLINAPAQRA